MQLFINDFQQTDKHIHIKNEDIIHQMRKVLRMKIGDIFFIQKNTIRHKVELLTRDRSTIEGIILDSITPPKNTKTQYSIAVAMSSKWSKAELITQKLSEIGINNIYLWPSDRSVIKEINHKKMERLHKISKEAVEQSRGRTLPNIEFIDNINLITKNTNKNIIVFDKTNQDKSQKIQTTNHTHDKILGIIGPEGGLTHKDYEKFGNNYIIQQLGENVLRTETASIIAGWIIKNF